MKPAVFAAGVAVGAILTVVGIVLAVAWPSMHLPQDWDWKEEQVRVAIHGIVS